MPGNDNLHGISGQKWGICYRINPQFIEIKSLTENTFIEIGRK